MSPADQDHDGGGGARTVSVRLDRRHLNIVQSIARIDNLTAGKLTRAALDAHHAARRQEPGSDGRVERIRARLDEMLGDLLRSPTTNAPA